MDENGKGLNSGDMAEALTSNGRNKVLPESSESDKKDQAPMKCAGCKHCEHYGGPYCTADDM